MRNHNFLDAAREFSTTKTKIVYIFLLFIAVVAELAENSLFYERTQLRVRIEESEKTYLNAYIISFFFHETFFDSLRKNILSH